MQSVRERRELRAVGALQIALGVVWATMFVYAVHGSMPFNAVHLPLEQKLQTNVFLPQGWKFFTRDPQQEDPAPYARDADGSWRASLPPSFSAISSGFGVNRAVRARGVEFGMIVSALPKTAWVDCNESPSRCLSRAPVAATVRNAASSRTLCGTVGVVAQRPVPWAWSRDARGIEMPSRVAIVEVRC